MIENSELFKTSEELMENFDVRSIQKIEKLEADFIKAIIKVMKEYQKNNRGYCFTDGTISINVNANYNMPMYEQISKIIRLGKANYFEEEYGIYVTDKTEYDLYVTPSYTLLWDYKTYFDSISKDKAKKL